MFFIRPAVQLPLDSLAKCGKSLPRPCNQLFPAPNVLFHPPQTPRPKRRLVHSVLHELHHHLVAVEVHQLLGGELLSKLLPQHLRVGAPDAVGNKRPDVAKHRLPDRERELVHVLMRQRQAQSILARFGEDRGERIRAEVLELVDEEVEVAAGFLRLVRPRHRGQLKLRHKQRPKQVRLVVPELALGQVGDEQPLVVHDEGEAHLALHLA